MTLALPLSLPLLLPLSLSLPLPLPSYMPLPSCARGGGGRRVTDRRPRR
jgi:hypothetical protein